MASEVWGANRDKWVIERSPGLRTWWVHPPLNSTWGEITEHANFDRARMSFIEQTAIVQSAWAGIKRSQEVLKVGWS